VPLSQGRQQLSGTAATFPDLPVTGYLRSVSGGEPPPGRLTPPSEPS